MDNDSYPRLRTSNNSSSLFGLRSLVIRLSLAHKFSMGFKSGDCAAISLHSLSYWQGIAEPLHLCVLDRYHAEIQNCFHTVDEQKKRGGELKSDGILGQSLFL